MSSLLSVLVLFVLMGVIVIVVMGRGMSKASREEGVRFRRVGDGLKELHAKMEKFSHVTPELLAQTPDEDLLECVLSNLWSKMKTDLSDAGSVLSSLSCGRTLIYSLYAVTGGLKQDGVKAFLKGKDAMFLPAASSALETLEAFDARDRLSDLQAERTVSAAAYLEAFDALDVKSRMTSYIRNHPEEFID